MKAVLLDVPQAMLDERRRLGHDRFDEMWNGVLHMVSPPSMGHQHRGTRLVALLHALAERAGMIAVYEAGLFRPGRNDDYRQPDNLVARPEHVSARGVEGRAELVVEIRSRGDEAYEKLPFFAEMQVQEVLILDGSSIELRRLAGDQYVLVDADPGGWVQCEAVPLELRSGPGEGQITARTADGDVVL